MLPERPPESFLSNSENAGRRPYRRPFLLSSAVASDDQPVISTDRSRIIPSLIGLNLWAHPALPETIAANKFPRASALLAGIKFVRRSGAPLALRPSKGSGAGLSP